MIKKIRKNLYEIILEANHLRNGCYPDFVKLNSPPPLSNEIPVFMFHTVKPEIFEDQLKLLAVNGYQTITCDEFCEMITQKMPIPEKTVLLTIDDGKSSVWVYAYPILKKYNFKASVFLIPGYMKENSDYIYNLEDYWNQKCQWQQVKGRDNEFDPLLTWQQVREMHDSGVIDFQCHTLYHHNIYTGSKILYFFNPSHRMTIFNVVIPKNFEDRLIKNNLEKLYGIPIYENQSLMAALPRYLNDSEIIERCIEYVSKNGGSNFFKKSSWYKELKQLTNNLNKGRTDHFHSKEETIDEIFKNLISAKKLIENKIPGKCVRHLSYPYGIGSREAVGCSKKAGYLSNFWVTHPSKSINRPGDNPFYCCRLKDDYIYRLPGAGRKSLSWILLQKLKRRIMGEPIY